MWLARTNWVVSRNCQKFYTWFLIGVCLCCMIADLIYKHISLVWLVSVRKLCFRCSQKKRYHDKKKFFSRKKVLLKYGAASLKKIYCVYFLLMSGNLWHFYGSFEWRFCYTLSEISSENFLRLIRSFFIVRRWVIDTGFMSVSIISWKKPFTSLAFIIKLGK